MKQIDVENLSRDGSNTCTAEMSLNFEIQWTIADASEREAVTAMCKEPGSGDVKDQCSPFWVLDWRISRLGSKKVVQNSFFVTLTVIGTVSDHTIKEKRVVFLITIDFYFTIGGCAGGI